MFFKLLFCLIAAFVSLGAGQKVVLLNDTTAHYSWGCTGTSSALKERIEALGFDLQALSIRVSYTLKEVPPFESFDDRALFERFCDANPDTVKALREAAVVVINGEGTTHDVRPAPTNLLYLAHISKVFLGKHVEMINHSAYPKEKGQEIYKKVYSELDYVAIREPLSKKEMDALGVVSTQSFDCLPLYIQDHYHKAKQAKEKQLVVSGSVAFTPCGASQVCRYMENMHERGFSIQVLIGALASPALDDEAFVHYLKSECKAPFQIVNATSMDEWLETIQQATLFVSGRFHHSIAAFCLNTPFIALNSNTYKVHGLCALLDQPAPLLYDDPDLLAQLMMRTDTLLTSPAVDNGAKSAELCQLAERNFDGLKALNFEATEKKIHEDCAQIAARYYSLQPEERLKEITQTILASDDTQKAIKEHIAATGRRFFLFQYPSDGYQVKATISFVPNPTENPLLLFLRGGTRIFGLKHPADDFTCVRDYTVLSTAYRGGVSEGEDQFGGDEVNDVHNLLLYLPTLGKQLELQFAPKSIYLLGGSRGGMEMFLALGRSPLFQSCITKAACLSGVLDMDEWMHSRKDIHKMFVRDFGLLPGVNEKEWVEVRSPLSAAAHLRKNLPIFLIQGSKDNRVAISHGYRMLEQLQAHGLTVDYLEVDGGDHCLRNQPHRMDWIVNWFEKP